MSGAFSFTGGQPRCFTFWQDFQKCYAGAETPSDCRPQAEDYYECLHQRKEIARNAQVQSHYQAKQARQLEHQKRDQAAEVGGIFALGLARREREEKERKEKDESGDDGEKKEDKDDEGDTEGGGDKGGDEKGKEGK